MGILNKIGESVAPKLYVHSVCDIDFEKLKQELSNEIVNGEESYDFTWVGKKQAIIEAMLFAAGREVKIKEIMNVLEIGSEDIDKIMQNMKFHFVIRFCLAQTKIFPTNKSKTFSKKPERSRKSM